MKATALIVSICPLVIFHLFSIFLCNNSRAQSISSASNLSLNHGGAAGAPLSSILEIPVADVDSSTRTFFATIRNDYSLSELSYGMIGAIFPLQDQSIGLGVSHFGFADYGLTNVHTAISKSIHEKIRIGTALTFSQLRIIEQTPKHSFKITVAGRFDLSNDLKTAILIDHFLSPEGTYNMLNQFGISYCHESDWIVFLDLRKQANNSPEVISSLKYTIEKDLAILFSVSSFQNIAGGLSLSHGAINYDLGIKFHRRLGLTAALTLSYQLRQ